MADTAQPLSGIVVLDLGQIYQGPYATFLMAMAGATVIKVEPPGGEHLRLRAPVGGVAMPFSMLNSNKLSLVLDLKTGEGRAVFLKLVARADVVLENFAPDTMDRLGLGRDVLSAANPRVICAAGSGYGRSGPYRDYPAMDLTVQAMAGIMSVTGYPDRPPVKAGPAVCDFSGGAHLFGAVMLALLERERSGVVRHVEVSMQEAVYPSLASSLSLWYSSGGESPLRTGNRHNGLSTAPYNVYPASDGYIAIICVGERQFGWLARAMEQPALAEDPRFATLRARVETSEALDEIITRWTRARSKEEAFQALLRERVPCAPVRDVAEVVNDPHMHARGMLRWVDHPEYGRMVLPGTPLRLDGLDPVALEPSHRLGEDSEAVLKEFAGLGAEDIAALRAAKAI
jgi:CoA:oxalate CoA-transferase